MFTGPSPGLTPQPSTSTYTPGSPSLSPQSVSTNIHDARPPGKITGLTPNRTSRLCLAHPLLDVNQSLHKSPRTDAGWGKNRLKQDRVGLETKPSTIFDKVRLKGYLL
jgi:hypothetical protein